MPAQAANPANFRALIRKAAALIFVAMLALLPASAAAVIPQPDSDPQILTHDVYRNLLEPGDFLVVVEYNIPYASPPTTSAGDTYILRMMSVDGLTQLGSNIPYPYNDFGYNYGVTSIYFTAAQVTSLGLTWEAAYILRLEGNPLQFAAAPPLAIYALAAGDYDPSTTADGSRAALATKVIAIAEVLQAQWAITLLTSGPSAPVLNSTGAQYFGLAIRSLVNMAPQAFSSLIVQPIATIFPTPTGTPFAIGIGQTFTDNDAIGKGRSALSVFFFGDTDSQNTVATMLTIIGYIAAIVVSYMKFGTATPGILIGFLLMPVGVYLGMPFAMMFIPAFIAALYGGYVIYARGG